MAKNNKKSLAEELRSAAIIWVGETNQENTYVLLANFGKHIHSIIVEDTKDLNCITIKAPKETTALSEEIFKILYEVFPNWKNKNRDKINNFLLPKGFGITKDLNDVLYKASIKPLKQTTVLKALEDASIDTSSYTYTKISVDNSYSITFDSIDKGYDKYPEEITNIMEDTSKYASYTMDKKDEYDMMAESCYLGIVAAGPAGTGKSTDPLIWAEQNKVPVAVTQCTQNMEEDKILSSFIPNQSGGYDLRKGILVQMFEHGGLVVINEANYLPSGVLSCLNSMMDDNGQVLLDDGTIVKRNKNFRLVLTVNPGYRGTNMFNEATLNRFATVYYPAITPEVLVKRLQLETGYKNTKVLEVIAEQFDKLRNIYGTRNMETEVTYRNVLRFLKMRLAFPKVDIAKQFDMAFINNAIFELNDISVDLADLQDIRKDMIKAISDSEVDGTEEVKEGSLDCEPAIDLDDLTSEIGDDGTFLDDGEDA